jgi:hypothetical protein
MKPMYEWYEDSCDFLARYELEKQKSDKHESIDEVAEMVKERQKVINNFDEKHPEFGEWYMRKKEMQKSFTQAQINFICEQIGDWYLYMKPLLEGQHNLGRMKEKLKTMICGEG